MFIFRFFPPLKAVINIAPLFATWVKGNVRIMLKESSENMPARVRKAQQHHSTRMATQDRPSIFSEILDSSLPAAEKTDRRLGGEGFSMISAGTETTSVSNQVNYSDVFWCLRLF